MVRSRFSPVLIVLLVALFPLSALAGNEVGKMRGNGSGIDWTVTRNDHESVILTVQAPDGTVYEKTFKGGQNPSFRSADLKKGGSVDGTYSYELRLEPRVSGQVKAALNAARAKGDDAAVAEIQRANGLDQEVVQSGAFGVLNGSFLDPDAVEADANDASAVNRRGITGDAASTRRPGDVAVDDQVIADDLIVQGSVCAGLDCVNGENFGFDTIRMKENNLRIHFDDTSTSAGFPANDWRIVANDSGSGGQNKLVFEDSTLARNLVTIEAAAPANSLYVDSTGNIGLQQSAPALDLHIATGDTPAMRYEQTNASGFTAQTWDIGANEANFFVRDVTGGSRLSFRIRPGAPTSSIDISSDGDVGVGTASPKQKLHVFSTAVTTFPTSIGAADFLVVENNGNSNMAFVASSTGQSVIRFVKDASTITNGALTYLHSSNALTFTTNNAERARFDTNGNLGLGVTAPTNPIEHSSGARLSAAGVWIDASSRGFKQNITELTAIAALDALKSLTPVSYQYKLDPTDSHVGFIAEDVPELVAIPSRDGLAPMDIVAVLTKVVKEQQATIEQLQQRLDKIENPQSQQ